MLWRPYLCGFLAMVWASLLYAAPSFVVITQAGNGLVHATRAQVAAVYLGHPHVLSDKALYPLDQGHGSALYRNFYQMVLGWPPSQVSSYWSSQVFSGGSSEPNQVDSDAAAIAVVSRYPQYIAYVHPQSIQGNARIHILYPAGGVPVSAPAPTSVVASVHPPSASSAPVTPATQASVEARQLSQIRQMDLSQASKPRHQAQQELGVISHPPADTSKQVAAPMHFSKGSLWPELISHFKLINKNPRPEVRFWIQRILSNRAGLNQSLNRMVPLLFYVYVQTKRFGMPAEFALQPLVESGYNPLARAQDGGVGLWQMMSETAITSGLVINWWYDGRLDILSATQAALYHSVLLYKKTHDWLLVFAAYNEGLTKVLRQLRHAPKVAQGSPFWLMHFNPVTQAYVPKLLAYATIIAHPARYGVHLPQIPSKPYFLSILLTAQVSLDEVAHISGVKAAQIHFLNPALLRWATNPVGYYHLLLPLKQGHVFAEGIVGAIKESSVSWQYYVCSPDDTLKRVAIRHQTSVSFLKRINHLTSDSVRTGQALLVPIYLSRVISKPITVEAVINESLLLPHHLDGPKVPKVPANLLGGIRAGAHQLKATLHKIYSQQ